MKTPRDKWLNDYYNLYWNELYKYSNNIIHDDTIAADIVQDVFISIWNNFDRLHIENPKAYLFQTVKNQTLYTLKNKKFDTVQLEVVYNLLSDSDLLTAEEQILFKEQLLQEIYNKAQEILPTKCLEVFTLRYYKNMSYKEIASNLFISESTVENHISKALKLLKSNLPLSIDFCILLSYLSLSNPISC
ncbi:MAG: RNA polymerase sigma-70 factor [Flavobacteriaceae bacterium]|jgi:RNA polymerase sigma-70 factor (ECF subfamily)|nr:RNA polymerase sigma-70 factor [Flavobacteriaceae bacterium]